MTTFHISTNGRDSNPGTEAEPFASIQQAKDAARAVRKDCKEESIEINIRPGIYTVQETLHFNQLDSGTPESLTTWRAPHGKARITAGEHMKESEWTAVTDTQLLKRFEKAARHHILQLDLNKKGINNFGTYTNRGFSGGYLKHATIPAALELFADDRQMPITRYPATGWLRTTGSIEEHHTAGFTYTDDRPHSWKPANDILVHGYWKYNWADSYNQLDTFDKDKGIIHITPVSHHDFSFPRGDNRRFAFLNILEELRAPGQWYLDRDTGILYFWPPDTDSLSKTSISIHNSVITLDNASHIQFDNLILSDCRAHAIFAKDIDNVCFTNCTIANAGQNGAVITHATHSGFRNCEIRTTGEGGVVLHGGDRQTLQPAGLFSTGCHIHDYSYWCRTYRAAIDIRGVGNTASRNTIHDAPHTAIFFGGNDHTIELNEIYRVCEECHDVGAVYCGRDWTMRGHLIRHNYLHNLGGCEEGAFEGGTSAIYLDDTFGGTDMIGNIIDHGGRGFLIGGGRDCTIKNNIIQHCEYTIHLDARAVNWAHELGCINADASGSWGIDAALDAVPYQSETYSKYPHLATILHDDPLRPKYNVITDNLILGGGQFYIDDEALKPCAGNTIDNNAIGDDAVDLSFIKTNDAKGREALISRVAWAQDIPFNQIGSPLCRNSVTCK